MAEVVAQNSRLASQVLAAIPTDVKNDALRYVKEALMANREKITEANKLDKDTARPLVEAGTLSSSLFKRLDIEGSKFDTILNGIDDVVKLEDPSGQVTLATRLDEGLDLYRVTCPIGVLCIIFEARPDAAVQISTLAIKSGNAVILKGGKEALHTNRAIVEAIQEGLAKVPDFPVAAVQLVDTREDIKTLLGLDTLIDLVIPRGSNDLVKYIKANTSIPVMGHADGICSVYVDKHADLEKAISVVVDAKTQYPSVCNATETLLVHEEVLASILTPLGEALAAKNVQLKADEKCIPFLPASVTTPSTPEDYRTEFLDFTLAVKCVNSVQEAVTHINSHGSHHTDAIVSEDPQTVQYFMARVDSAGVFHNASTRFADGFRFGFGAEVGVSTNRIHARGPVGLDGLVIYKYRMYGHGHVVADFAAGRKQFMHVPIEKKLPQLQ